MNDIGIFVFGCAVLGVVIGAVICGVIASDRPNEGYPTASSESEKSD